MPKSSTPETATAAAVDALAARVDRLERSLAELVDVLRGPARAPNAGPERARLEAVARELPAP